MNGIVVLLLGFVLGVVVAVTVIMRYTAFVIKNDKDFRDAMDSIDNTGACDSIVEFFYGKKDE